MTHSATITIQFTDYWLSSTGGSGKGDLDMVCYRDRDGCPALPMTQVKGMLRETAELLWPDAEVFGFFGERAKENAPAAEGALRFAGDAQLPKDDRAWFAAKANNDKRAALFARLRSTAVTEAGVAKTNSLRTAEVAVPLTLTGRIDWTGSERPPENWIKRLNQLCQLTFTFGHGKNDGLGRAVASCSEFKPDTVAAGELSSSGKRLVIDLVPEDASVFSRINANEGQQLSHAGPTGASLWGWAIGQLKNDPAALKALLSGKISFSDAAPLIDDATPAFMRPAVLFAPKLAKTDQEKPFIADKVFQPGALLVGMKKYVEKHTESRQAQGFGAYHMPLALDGIAPVGKGHRLRSGHEQGKAKDGSLFGYQHIAPRITGYRAVAHAVDDLDEALWGKIVAAFQNRLFLGKARNNGYGGGYKVSSATNAELVPVFNREITHGATIVRIWCLSDLALYDDWGALKIEPTAKDFGVSDCSWKLDRTESSVTTRRYAPWDGAIQGHEREITVIEAGSVIAFSGPPLVEKLDLAERYGDYPERGCGWVALVPDETPKKAGDFSSAVQDGDTPDPTDLTKWAEDRTRQLDPTAMEKWLSDATRMINSLESLPTRTQWSKVVFDGKEENLRDDQRWNVKVGNETLKEWLIREAREKCKDISEDGWPQSHRLTARKRLIDHAKRKASSMARDER
jgi:hypothetical protein